MCDIAQKHMKQEYEFWQNLFVALMIIGIFLCIGALSNTTLIIGTVMIVAGVIGCSVFEYKLENLNKDMSPKDIARIQKKIDKVQEPCVPHPVKLSPTVQKEYSFYTYLADNDCSMEEFIEIIREHEKPKQKLDEVYKKYCQVAGSQKVQTKEQVTTMIVRARRRM